MNYLAHAYLSFDQGPVVVGNLISDFVKGKKRFDFPPAIQEGIRLHRAIDQFTDTHPVIGQAKALFRNPYRLYAGALVDVVFDHFLAIDPGIFPRPEDLEDFARRTYGQLEDALWQTPPRFQQMFAYMRRQNWLFHYRYREGVQHSLGGLVRRAAYLTDAGPAMDIFSTHYGTLGRLFEEFFPSLRSFAFLELQKIQAAPES